MSLRSIHGNLLDGVETNITASLEILGRGTKTPRLLEGARYGRVRVAGRPKVGGEVEGGGRGVRNMGRTGVGERGRIDVHEERCVVLLGGWYRGIAQGFC